MFLFSVYQAIPRIILMNASERILSIRTLRTVEYQGIFSDHREQFQRFYANHHEEFRTLRSHLSGDHIFPRSRVMMDIRASELLQEVRMRDVALQGRPSTPYPGRYSSAIPFKPSRNSFHINQRNNMPMLSIIDSDLSSHDHGDVIVRFRCPCAYSLL